MPNKTNSKPSSDFLDKTKKELQKRFTESKKIVDSKKESWKNFKNLYKTKQTPRQHTWESNLIIPKANYIISTIHPQIMTTIFAMAQWVTFKNPMMDSVRKQELEKWFVWFCERVVKLYVAMAELFKAAPIYGTSFAKILFQHGVPAVDYAEIDSILPMPTIISPGTLTG